MESSNETFKHFLEYTGILATLNYMAGKPEGIQKVELRKEIGLSANPAKKVEEILLESNLLTFNDQISRLVLTEKGQAVSELVSASFDILQPKSSGGDGILLENSGIVKMLLFLEGSNGPVKKNAFRKDLGLSPNPIDRNLSLLVSEQLSSQIDDGYQITEKGKIGRAHV